MAILMFSDMLKIAGLDPKNVLLIRHTVSTDTFRDCMADGKVYEYTCHQDKDFGKKYEYWAVFIGDKGSLAKFHSIYRVNGSIPDTKKNMPDGMPASEAKNYTGEHAIHNLEPVDCLQEYEGKLIIDWGLSARSWYQKATNEKEVVSIMPDEKKVFQGYENIVLSYDELKDVVENEVVYEAWHTALSSVYAIYLIVDTKNGKQYVGSAYGEDGLLGRWKCYVATHHGGNKLMKEELCAHPERYHMFQFSILQILPKTMTDEKIIELELLWKKKLMSIEYGMNAN